MTSQCICVVQLFHSAHQVCTLYLLSAHRGWYYGCAQNTQDWLSTSRSTTEIMDWGFEAFGSFWIQWLIHRKNRSAHVSRLPFRCLDIDCAFGDTYCCITQRCSLLTNTGKTAQILAFGLNKISAWEKGNLLRNPRSRATPQILRSPKFKKGYTYLAHPKWFSSSSP